MIIKTQQEEDRSIFSLVENPEHVQKLSDCLRFWNRTVTPKPQTVLAATKLKLSFCFKLALSLKINIYAITMIPITYL
jgi:hypothetical protein